MDLPCDSQVHLKKLFYTLTLHFKGKVLLFQKNESLKRTEFGHRKTKSLLAESLLLINQRNTSQKKKKISSDIRISLVYPTETHMAKFRAAHRRHCPHYCCSLPRLRFVLEKCTVLRAAEPGVPAASLGIKTSMYTAMKNATFL